MKCQLWLSSTTQQLQIFSQISLSCKCSHFKCFSIKELKIQLLQLDYSLPPLNVSAEGQTSQTSSHLNWNDEIADVHPKLYLDIYYIYNLGHQVTPTKWIYSYSRAGKGSIQTEVCFLARKKGTCIWLHSGFISRENTLPLVIPAANKALLPHPLLLSQFLKVFLMENVGKSSFPTGCPFLWAEIHQVLLHRWLLNWTQGSTNYQISRNFLLKCFKKHRQNCETEKTGFLFGLFIDFEFAPSIP